MSVDSLVRHLTGLLRVFRLRPQRLVGAGGNHHQLIMGGPAAELKDTAIFVTTVGERLNFDDCINHLNRQTAVAPVEVIDHVAPMSAAFQEMHTRCQTQFYVQVDEDMLLAPHAIASLRALIGGANEQTALACAPLWDCDAERPIYGVKIYRTSIVKQFPYRNSASCEVDQLERIREAGYLVLLQPLDRNYCLGEHGKHYTPETIFRRWQNCFYQHRLFGRMDWIEPYPRKLLERYLRTGNVLHLYAFLGAISGLTDSILPSEERDWRHQNEALARLQKYFPFAPSSDAEK